LKILGFLKIISFVPRLARYYGSEKKVYCEITFNISIPCERVFFFFHSSRFSTNGDLAKKMFWGMILVDNFESEI
jgi:hypothetical protein